MRSPGVRKGGFAVILSLVVVTILAVIVGVLISMNSSALLQVQKDGEMLQTKFAAEAGAWRAVAEIAENGLSGNSNALSTNPSATVNLYTNEPLGKSPVTYTVAVTRGPATVDGIDIPDSEHYYIESLGQSTDASAPNTRKFSVLIRTGAASSFDTAIFADNSILMDNGYTDVYSSSGNGNGNGNPNAWNNANGTNGNNGNGNGPSSFSGGSSGNGAAGRANIGTNSTATQAVVLTGPAAEVDQGGGDILVGPGGGSSAVTAQTGTYGNISPLSQHRTLDPVALPFSSGGQDRTITSLSLPLTGGVYGDVVVDGPTARLMLIPGETYQFKSLTIDNGGKIALPLSTVAVVPHTEIFIEDNFEIRNGGVINPFAKPEKLRFFAAGTAPVTLTEDASQAYYVCYAPGSDIVVDNSAEIYGAVIGNNVVLKGTANSPAAVHYDLDLQQLDLLSALGGGGTSGVRVLHTQHL